MNQQTWWYLSRASGIVAWVLLAATCVWGVLLATRMLRPADRPAWLLDLHRWLGALGITTTAVHLGALVADSYLTFGWRELLVPEASAWRPRAVTFGVVALYLLAVVEVSSLVMRRLPRRWWRVIHLGSYAAFGSVTVHGVLAGTDVTNRVMVVVGAAVLGALGVTVVARLVHRRGVRAARVRA